MTLWHIWIFDAIVWALLGAAVFLIVGVCVRPARRWMWRWLTASGDPHPPEDGAEDDVKPTPRHGSRLERVAVIAGIVGGYLAVYVAYGTLRNQSMLAAKTAINADAGRLLDWERASPHIRCLYNWYSTYDDGDACLAAIATDGDRFSEASLYVEEVFFILKQAKSDEQAWRSGYIQSIEYWRAGVDEDPTGLFGNYLATVNSYTSPANTIEKVRADIRASGIKMPNVCDGHYRVRACFRAVGRDVRVSEACVKEPISAKAARSLPKLIATCKTTAAAKAKAAAEAKAKAAATQ